VNELQKLIDSAAKFQALMPLDCCVMICDDTGLVVKYVAAKTFDMNVTEGEKAQSGGALDKCLKTRQDIHVTLNKELYGVAVKAIATPVYEEGNLVGAIATGTSMATQQTLHEASQTIASTAEEITATTEEMASMAMRLSEELTKLKDGGQKVLAEIKKTDEILQFVSDVAANSNLLGLNAAIEAARAGEHGRGFAVVADEIRKMADNSATSVKDIKSILHAIQNEVVQIVDTITQTAVVGERQAAASEEISASMEQLAASAQNVERIAEIV
jgi:methyl-accepting chemotaxis protein